MSQARLEGQEMGSIRPERARSSQSLHLDHPLVPAQENLPAASRLLLPSVAVAMAGAGLA